MKRGLLIDAIAALLILLFVYTAISKWLDITTFMVQMRMQTLPHGLQTFLIWTLPPIEIITSGFLFFKMTKLAGLYLSAFLMALFTGYVILVLLHVFSRMPCSCGGVLRSMNWEQHLYFNLLFLLLSITGIYLLNRERRIAVS
jgi:putative oxidoreductase